MAEAARSIGSLGNVSMDATTKLWGFADVLEKVAGSVESVEATARNAGIDVDKWAEKVGGQLDNSRKGIKKKFNQYASDLVKIVTDTVSQFYKAGAKIGKVIGTIIGFIGGNLLLPGLGTLLAPIVSKIVEFGVGINAAFIGLITGSLKAAVKQVNNIINAILNIFKSIGNVFTTVLPGIIGKIAKSAAGIAGALFNFGKTILSAAKNILGNIIGGIGNFFGSIIGIFTGGGGGGKGGWRSLGDTIFSAMFKFEVLKQIIRGIINEIKSLAKEAVAAAGGIQTLTARLNFLIASQAQASKVAANFNEAMKMAVPYTQDLLLWMQKLALASPIGIDDIAKTVSMSIAMGWTAESAKTLTKAIVDYTSATGLSSDVAERIIYNFAQMKQQGKVTGTELRDLGRGAFMPINRILEIMYKDLQNSTDATKKFNGTFQQFREEASAGKVDVEEFFTAFEKFVGEFMPDAAYKMNYTFEAVMNNLQDLFKILLGWNVLGPVIKSLTKPLQDFIDKFKSDEVLLSANRIGKGLAYLVESIKTGVGSVLTAIGKLFTAAGIVAPTIENIVKTMVEFGMAIKAIGNLIANLIDKYLMPFAYSINKNFGDTFSKMRSNFFRWGADLIVSFAKGMISATAKALTAAINFIAGVLTWWFHASVPNILPDIEKWGMDTIAAWLHGFTEADFSVLDSLEGAVKQSLDAMTALGQITSVQAAQQYVSVTVELMRALDEFNRTGKVSAGIYDKLRSVGGTFGNELVKLLDDQLALAQATEFAAQAQRDYDKAIKASQASQVKVSNSVRDYNALVRKGADKNTLRNRLKLVNASQIELGVNKKAEIMAKANLDAANDALKPLQDQVKLQENIIKQLAELAQGNKDVAGAAEAAAGMAEDLGLGFEGAFGDIKEALEDLDFAKWVSEAEADFNDWLTKDLPALWGDAWYNAFQNPASPFQMALANIKPSFEKAVGGLKTVWDDFAKHLGLPTIDEILDAWLNVPPITTTIPPEVTFPGQPPGFMPANIDPSKLGPTTRTTPDWIGRIKAVFQLFSDAIKNDGGILEVIKGIGLYFWDKLVGAITGKDYGIGAGKGIGGAASFGASLATGGSPLHATIMDLLNGIVDKIKEALAPGSDFRTKLGGLADKLMTAIADELFPENADTYSSGPGGKGGNSPGQRILDGIVSFLDKNVDQIKGIGKTLAGNIWDGLIEGLNEKMNGLAENSLPGKIGGGVLRYFGFDPTKSIWDNIKGAFTGGTTEAPTPEDTGFDLSTWASGFGDAGVAGATAIFTNFDSTMSAADWNTTFSYPTKAIESAWEMGSPSQVFTDYGENAAQSLYDGTNNLITKTLDWNSMWNFILLKTREILGLDKGLMNPFYLVGQDMVWGIIAGFQSMIETLKAEWNALVMLLPEDARDKWLIASPSKLFKGIGANVVKGLALGISDSMYLARGAMNGLINTTALPSFVMSAPVSAPPVYGGNTANFNGDIHINNGMDWAMFKAQVQRAIVEG